jgi:hypothetical protein
MEGNMRLTMSKDVIRKDYIDNRYSWCLVSVKLIDT